MNSEIDMKKTTQAHPACLRASDDDENERKHSDRVF